MSSNVVSASPSSSAAHSLISTRESARSTGSESGAFDSAMSLALRGQTRGNTDAEDGNPSSGSMSIPRPSAESGEEPATDVDEQSSGSGTDQADSGTVAHSENQEPEPTRNVAESAPPVTHAPSNESARRSARSAENNLEQRSAVDDAAANARPDESQDAETSAQRGSVRVNGHTAATGREAGSTAAGSDIPSDVIRAPATRTEGVRQSTPAPAALESAKPNEASDDAPAEGPAPGIAAEAEVALSRGQVRAWRTPVVETGARAVERTGSSDAQQPTNFVPGRETVPTETFRDGRQAVAGVEVVSSRPARLLHPNIPVGEPAPRSVETAATGDTVRVAALETPAHAASPRVPRTPQASQPADVPQPTVENRPASPATGEVHAKSQVRAGEGRAADAGSATDSKTEDATKPAAERASEQLQPRATGRTEPLVSRASDSLRSFVVPDASIEMLSRRNAAGIGVAKIRETVKFTSEQKESSAPAKHNLPPGGAVRSDTATGRTGEAPVRSPKDVIAGAPESRFAKPGGESVSMVFNNGAIAQTEASVADASTGLSGSPKINEQLLLRMVREVGEFKRFNAESMAVVLKPDGKTEIFLHLAMKNGQVEVNARFERGDLSAIAGGWNQLQQTMQQQGVKLGPLQESPHQQTGQFDQQGTGQGRQYSDRRDEHGAFGDGLDTGGPGSSPVDRRARAARTAGPVKPAGALELWA